MSQVFLQTTLTIYGKPLKSEASWLFDTLDSLLAGQASLHHALLLTGPSGIGKEWLARQLAAALLCERGTGRACGACASCRWCATDSHPDCRVVRPAADEAESADAETVIAKGTTKPSREIRIEQIRGLSGFTETASHRGGRKIVLITPADAMNSASANALLKTLEEPHPGTHFLLVSSRPERLAATVRSRCRKIQIPAPPPGLSKAWVMKVTGADASRVAAWLAYASGAPLRAVELAQSDAGRVLERLVEVIGGLPGDALGSAEALAEHEPRVWAHALHAWCIDLARCAAGASPAKFPRHATRLAELGRAVDREALYAYEAWLSGLARVVTHPLSPKLLAEDALLRYQATFRNSERHRAG